MSRLLLNLVVGGALVLPSLLHAAEPMTVSVQRLTADTALRIAQGALAACRQKGIQIAATVVDRDGTVQAALIDIHAEATSEKMATGHFCDGRASLVVGTHTHVPTGDAQILPGDTAYLTDAGMCGDYNSVIGMDKVEPLRRFITGMPKARFTPAADEATLSGLYVETDNMTGKATRVEMVRQGGRLSQTGPE